MKGGCPLKAKFAGIKNNGLKELLEGMLELNPAFRLTAKEALKHKIFDKLRVKSSRPRKEPM